jgi:hypothetical protein
MIAPHPPQISHHGRGLSFWLTQIAGHIPCILGVEEARRKAHSHRNCVYRLSREEPRVCRTSSECGKGAPMKPGDFPIGSAQSRAVARAMLIKQSEEDNEFSAGCLVIWTGLPMLKGEPIVATPPDTLAYYTLPDGSIVQVIRRHWAGEGRSGVTAGIHQFSADGVGRTAAATW